jgi:hypothetical protein
MTARVATTARIRLITVEPLDVIIPNRASGAFLQGPRSTIRSSKLDVQVTGSADRGVAALLSPPT